MLGKFKDYGALQILNFPSFENEKFRCSSYFRLAGPFIPNKCIRLRFIEIKPARFSEMDKFKPEEEDIVLDRVIKYRWIASFCLGPLWGLLGIQGLFGIALYGLLIVMFSLMVVKNYR